LAHLPENSPTDPQSLLVIGGTSDIGRACALRFAEAGYTILLADNDTESLAREADDIKARSGAAVSLHSLDILKTETFTDFIAQLPVLPDIVLTAEEFTGDQHKAESDLDHSSMIMRANFESPALLLGLFAEKFTARNSGVLIGVSSVSGDRGCARNYVYGAAKAGLNAFLSGLRNRFGNSEIRVVTVKPGFVRTGPIENVSLPRFLTAEPRQVAQSVYRAAVTHRRDVVYAKSIWCLVSAIIAVIPESLFKRMHL